MDDAPNTAAKATSTLCRKVPDGERAGGEQVLKDSCLNKITASQKAKQRRILKSRGKIRSPNPWAEFLFTLLIEIISSFDLISDVFLLVMLFHSGHLIWTVI